MSESGRRHRLPLGTLRSRLRDVTEGAGLRSLLELLAGDDRRGAVNLTASCRRRLEAWDQEQVRMEGLFAIRRSLLRGGVRQVAGVDEVGMGPLAGPVVAAAVILPDRVELPGLNDSKRVKPDVRIWLAARIREQARAVCVAEVGPAEVDRLNVYRAGLLAMQRAVAGLEVEPDHVLVDARRIPDLRVPQTPLVRGDQRDGSIAAASIVAKVHRDALMERLDHDYPVYGFASHKGYGTERHLAALRRHGPSPIHRRSFAPLAGRPGP